MYKLLFAIKKKLIKVWKPIVDNRKEIISLCNT